MPVESTTQKFAWLGVTGSGKTYGASKFSEQLWEHNAQFVVLDPVGVWYGLRLAKDGKKPSTINIPIFGGLHGDVPLEPTGGELIANLIVDKGLSCIIDVSQFEHDTDKARFAKDFANRLFFRKKSAPSAIHLFLEECQEFVPQNPQRGEEQMLHAFIRMQKLGRNFGIGSSYISQRPQEVNKKALNMCQTLFVFRTTGTHERTAIEKWIEDKSLDESIAQDLPKIPTGSCHVWSPEFLKISEMIQITEKETFNASATPEVGAVAKARHLAPIDLDKVRDEMKATIEKAKGEDPKALRAKIADLEKKARGQTVKVGTDPKAIEKALESHLIAFRSVENAYKNLIDRWENHSNEIRNLCISFSQQMEKLTKSRPSKNPGASYIETSKKKFKVMPVPIPKKYIEVKKFEKPVPAESFEGELTGPEQRILNALAWAESINMMKPAQEMICFLSGYSHVRSTGYTNPRGYLRSKEMIDYKDGSIWLTDEGRSHAEAPETPLTLDELHKTVLEKLDGPEKKLLVPLLEAYPNKISNEDLCQMAGYAHVRSTGYTNPRGRLRSFGLIEYSSDGVTASPVLFL